jgi:hypothetical protein
MRSLLLLIFSARSAKFSAVKSFFFGWSERTLTAEFAENDEEGAEKFDYEYMSPSFQIVLWGNRGAYAG